MRIGIFCELLPEWAALSNCRTASEAPSRASHKHESLSGIAVWGHPPWTLKATPPRLKEGNWVLSITTDKTLDLGELTSPTEQFVVMNEEQRHAALL